MTTSSMRTSIASLLLASLLVAAPLAAAPPNIVVFLVDDMGVMDTSVPVLTGEDGRPKRYPLNDYYRTPSMDRLAAGGIRFNNFMAMSVCSPTRGAPPSSSTSAPSARRRASRS